MGATGFVTSHAFLEHDTGPEHPERAARLVAIEERLAASGLAQELCRLEPERADLAWLREVHDSNYVEAVHQASLHGPQRLDADTVVSLGSWEAALLGVGGALEAARRVSSREWDNAFIAARPPGHHAESSHAMGFCLFNTAVIAARFAQRVLGHARVAILDWDVHHGNGTQHLTERDPSIFYASLHQFPHYPGTGSRDERGLDDGEGSVLNVPMAAGDGDAQYLAEFEGAVLPAIEAFAPDFLILSAGFDAHERDPLSATRVSTAGFARMSEGVLELAARAACGRLISILEGGYDLEGLSSSVEAHLEAMRRA
jgi:acetoin utilization deacetylase AcuC-like enzyme